MDVSEGLKLEIEQNANIVYEAARDFVCEMQPSLTAATIAFFHLHAEAARELIMSDWTEDQRGRFSGLVKGIVEDKMNAAFKEAADESEKLVKPPISSAAIMVADYARSYVKH